VARNTAECYSALPVELRYVDRLYYFKQRSPDAAGLTNITTDFFVEPHSHLLTTIGIQTDCVNPFAALYRGLNGGWLRHGPGISLAADPISITGGSRVEGSFHDVGDAPELDFEKGGIYTAKAVCGMESARMTGRICVDTSVQLGRKRESEGWKGDGTLPLSMIDGFGHLENLHPLSAFWGWVELWGRWASAIFGLILLFKFVTWVGGLVLRLFGDRYDPRFGVLLHIIVCLFPSLGPFVVRKFYNTPGALGAARRRIETNRRAAAIAAVLYGTGLQANLTPTAPDNDEEEPEDERPATPMLVANVDHRELRARLNQLAIEGQIRDHDQQ
jgi:hypothetical protein